MRMPKRPRGLICDFLGWQAPSAFVRTSTCVDLRNISRSFAAGIVLGICCICLGCQPGVEANGKRGSADSMSSGKSPPDIKARPQGTVRTDGKIDLTFDQLEFAIERDEDFDDRMLTNSIRSLKGKQVVIRGFMLAGGVYQQSGITQFVLIRDNQECCFGPGAYIYHNVQIDMVPGRSADFTSRPVTVEGIFDLRPFLMDNKCYSIYHITADKVR